METLIIVIGVIAGLGLLMWYSAAMGGFVVYKFWYWFLLPIFPNLPHINYWEAVSLMMFINLCKSSYTDNIKKEYKDSQNFYIIKAILNPILQLLIGYIVYKCIY